MKLSYIAMYLGHFCHAFVHWTTTVPDLLDIYKYFVNYLVCCCLWINASGTVYHGRKCAVNMSKLHTRDSLTFLSISDVSMMLWQNICLHVLVSCRSSKLCSVLCMLFVLIDIYDGIEWCILLILTLANFIGCQVNHLGNLFNVNYMYLHEIHLLVVVEKCFPFSLRINVMHPVLS